MFEKWSENDGFMLIESLLSLSLMTMGLVILLPAVARFYSIREQQKMEVEMYRVMYDTALVWNDESRTENVQYGKWDFDVLSSRKSIKVTGPEAVSKQMELKKIEFQN